MHGFVHPTALAEIEQRLIDNEDRIVHHRADQNQKTEYGDHVERLTGDGG